MERIWQRIEAWLKINASEILASLESGASEAEIKKKEAILGREFPEDFKTSYLIHNGLEELNIIWIDNFWLISLERIVDEWQVWQELFDDGEFDDPEEYYPCCQLDR